MSRFCSMERVIVGGKSLKKMTIVKCATLMMESLSPWIRRGLPHHIASWAGTLPKRLAVRSSQLLGNITISVFSMFVWAGLIVSPSFIGCAQSTDVTRIHPDSAFVHSDSGMSHTWRLPSHSKVDDLLSQQLVGRELVGRMKVPLSDAALESRLGPPRDATLLGDSALVLLIGSGQPYIEIFDIGGLYPAIDVKRLALRRSTRPTTQVATLSTSGLSSDFALVDDLGQITHYSITDDSVMGVSHMSKSDDRVAASDACSLDGDFYILGNRRGSERVIHRFSSDGHHLGSFAQIYKSPSSLVNRQLSRGLIDCLDSDSTKLVIYAPAHLPEVRAYTPSGSLVWSAHLADFRPIEIHESRGGTRIELPESGYHRNARLLSNKRSGTTVLLEVVFSAGGALTGGTQNPRVGTLCVDGRTGKARVCQYDSTQVIALRSPYLLIQNGEDELSLEVVGASRLGG